MSDRVAQVPTPTQGAVAVAPASDLATAGMLINGRYEIVDLLGRGGMGLVYRVHDRALDTQLALKLLNPTLGVHLLKAEFLLLAELSHPHIARVHDFAGWEGTERHFFTMDLVSGRNVLDATARSSVEDILALVVQVLRALAYLHKRGWVHLDVKPANVLVSADGKARLLDFGIARAIDGVGGRTLGTPRYVAPELAWEGHDVDQRADLYSVGVTLFQLLFRRIDDAATRAPPSATAAEPRLTLTDDERARVPGWLHEVLARLTAPEPDQRFRTAGEAIHAIAVGQGRKAELETAETQDSYLTTPSLADRRAEAEALGRLVNARHGSGKFGPVLALCSGPTGSGKTRLLGQLRRESQAAGSIVLSGHCYDDALSPYSAWQGIVEQLGRELEGSAARQGAPHPFSAGLPTEHDAGPAAEALRILDGLMSLGRPCVVTIEDAHGMAPFAVELFEHLLEACVERQRTRAVPIAFVCTARGETAGPLSDAVSRLASLNAVLEVPLRPLGPPQVQALLGSMLGSLTVPPAVVSALAAVTGGNPGAIIELMRAWLRKGQLAPLSSGWQFPSPEVLEQVSATLSEVLEQRVRECSEAELGAVAALGVAVRPLSLAQLASTLAVDATAAQGVARALRARGLVLVSRDETIRLGWQHFGEAAQQLVGDDAIRQYHRRLATALEAQPDPALVARHYELGGDRERAGAWYCKATENRFARGDLRLTIAHARAAEACGAPPEALGRACSLAADAGRVRGEMEAAKHFAQRALQLSPAGSPEWLRASRAVIASFRPGP